MDNNTEHISRKLEFDIAKAMAMYLVIYGHVIQYIINGDFMSNTIWLGIYVFHVPLFFIISGYFIKFNVLTSQLHFDILSYFRKLICPSLIICALTILALLLLSFIFNKRLVQYNSFIDIMLLDCWFLKSLFASICVLYCCSFILNKYIRIVVLFLFFLAFGFWIKDIFYVSYSLPYIVLGNIIREYYEKIVDNFKVMFLVVVSVLIFSIFWKSQYLIFFTPLSFNLHSISVNVYRILYAFSVSLFLILLLRKIVFLIPKTILNPISNIGRNTLIIYLLQYLVLERILCFIDFSTGSWCIDNFIIVPLLSLFLVIIFHIVGLCLFRNIDFLLKK